MFYIDGINLDNIAYFPWATQTAFSYVMHASVRSAAHISIHSIFWIFNFKIDICEMKAINVMRPVYRYYWQYHSILSPRLRWYTCNVHIKYEPYLSLPLSPLLIPQQHCQWYAFYYFDSLLVFVFCQTIGGSVRVYPYKQLAPCINADCI